MLLSFSSRIAPVLTRLVVLTLVSGASMALGPAQMAGAQNGTTAPHAPAPDSAARTAGSVGVGLQVGQPGGGTVKWYRTPSVAYSAVVTSDGDDYVFLVVNRLWEAPLRDSPLGAYVGPGVLTGATELNRRGALALGINGVAGLNFYVDPFEVFLQVTPRFRFLPNRRDDVGGTVGLRLYF